MGTAEKKSFRIQIIVALIGVAGPFLTVRECFFVIDVISNEGVLR